MSGDDDRPVDFLTLLEEAFPLSRRDENEGCGHDRQSHNGLRLPCATCWDSGDLITVPRQGPLPPLWEQTTPDTTFETVTFRRIVKAERYRNGAVARWYEWDLPHEED